MRLNNRVAIVTGARRGLGRAIALALAKEGADIAICDVNREDCLKVVAEIEKQGRKGLAVKCDVSSQKDVEGLIRSTAETFGIYYRFGYRD
jgi:NAD(P)-dependent dehydrogenase (short-subunit alcohol dehydrogenase family)